MYVYEESQGYATDYVLPSKGLTAAKFAAAVAIGFGVSVAIANAFVGAFVSAGICVVVDRMISSTGVIVRATRYELSYYGEDKLTSKRSSRYQGGRRYKVTSSGFHLDEEYTEGSVYSASKPRNRISELLAQNLYGTGFHVYDKK